MPDTQATYYVCRTTSGMLELRQTRFFGLAKRHPHDVCAIARDRAEMEGMVALLKGTVDWSRVKA